MNGLASRVSMIAALVLLLSVWSCPQPAQVPVGNTSPTPSHFDGPAELPRIYVRSTLADTPAPGQVRLVKGSDSLQDAIDRSRCGDTLKLEAGATFQGLFRLPDK